MLITALGSGGDEGEDGRPGVLCGWHSISERKSIGGEASVIHPLPLPCKSLKGQTDLKVLGLYSRSEGGRNRKRQKFYSTRRRDLIFANS